MELFYYKTLQNTMQLLPRDVPQHNFLQQSMQCHLSAYICQTYHAFSSPWVIEMIWQRKSYGKEMIAYDLYKPWSSLMTKMCQSALGLWW